METLLHTTGKEESRCNPDSHAACAAKPNSLVIKLFRAVVTGSVSEVLMEKSVFA